MKYKVGDRVRVRRDLRIDSVYYMKGRTVGDTFVVVMFPFCGEVVTIDGYSDGKYRIKEFGFNWVDEMFEDNRFEEFIRGIVCSKSEIE